MTVDTSVKMAAVSNNLRKITRILILKKKKSANYLHFYLLALGVLEKEFYPGFPVIRGAFKLRELVSPQYGL